MRELCFEGMAEAFEHLRYLVARAEEGSLGKGERRCTVPRSLPAARQVFPYHLREAASALELDDSMNQGSNDGTLRGAARGRLVGPMDHRYGTALDRYVVRYLLRCEPRSNRNVTVAQIGSATYPSTSYSASRS